MHSNLMVYVGIASFKLLVFTAKNNFVSEKSPDNQQKTTTNCNIVATFVLIDPSLAYAWQLGLWFVYPWQHVTESFDTAVSTYLFEQTSETKWVC